MASIDEIDQLRDALLSINDADVKIHVHVHSAKTRNLDESFSLKLVPSGNSAFIAAEKYFGENNNIVLSVLDPEKG